MSTNFYLMPDGTTDTDDATVLHVLKRSSGYSIQAHRDSPFGEIASWGHWRTILGDLPAGWTLRDEYGATINTADLITEVDGVSRAERSRYARNQNYWINQHFGRVHPVGGPETAWGNTDSSMLNHWLDAEGYWIVGVDFS